MGPAKWSYFYLYVILDIFSRRVVGWCVADAESTVLFKALFDDAFVKHGILPGQLTLHADRGGPMTAKPTAFLLADLGVTQSHSRPHTSNDNPFSEAHFKTLKYHVWTAPGVQGFCLETGCGSKAFMCPACWRGHMAAGPDGIRKQAPNNRAA
jgi:transposase InsO family protein